MCGILAIILADPNGSAVTDIHNGLPILQHRGQDACGIATCGPRGRIYTRKGNGLCSEVFKYPEQLMDLPGNMGLGHCTLPLVLALIFVFLGLIVAIPAVAVSIPTPTPMLIMVFSYTMDLHVHDFGIKSYLFEEVSDCLILLRNKQCAIPPPAPQRMPKPSHST